MIDSSELSFIILAAISLGGCGSSGRSGGETGGTPSTGNVGGSNALGTGGAGGAGTAGRGGNAAADCANTTNQYLDPTKAGAFATSVYSYGDSSPAPTTADPSTTFCLDSPSSGQLCMSGLGAEACGNSSPCDYHRWGAGIGISLASHDTAGKVTKAFDATAAGVAGLSFTLSGAPSNGLSVQLVLADDPSTTVNEASSAFVLGGGTGPIKTDGTTKAMFSQFSQPSWGNKSLTFDPTMIDTIQWQVNTKAGATTPYALCLSDLKLLDADGNAVTVTAGAGGSAGSGGSGGAGGAAP